MGPASIMCEVERTVLLEQDLLQAEKRDLDQLDGANEEWVSRDLAKPHIISRSLTGAVHQSVQDPDEVKEAINNENDVEKEEDFSE